MAATAEISIRFHADDYDAPVAAFNVKHYSWPHDIDDILAEAARIMDMTTDNAAEMIDNEATMMFWRDADRLAQEAGFENVRQDGRSGGWCVPVIDGEGVSEDEMRENSDLRQKYHALEQQISDLLRDVNDVRRQLVRDFREEAVNFDGC